MLSIVCMVRMGFIWKRRARIVLSELLARSLLLPVKWCLFHSPGWATITCVGSFLMALWKGMNEMFDKEKLKQAMDDHGDTNKALAVFLGMTASNFSTIWNGRQPFQRKHIVRIAVRYQLSPQDVWDIFFLADAEAIKKEAREA